MEVYRRKWRGVKRSGCEECNEVRRESLDGSEEMISGEESGV